MAESDGKCRNHLILYRPMVVGRNVQCRVNNRLGGTHLHDRLKYYKHFHPSLKYKNKILYQL